MNLSTFLLNGVIFTLAMPAMALAASYLLRRYAPARASLFFATLAAVAVWPLLVVGASSFKISQVEVHAPGWTPPPRTALVQPVQTGSSVVQPTPVAPTTPQIPSVPLVLAWIWAAGSVVVGVVTLLDYIRAIRLAKRTQALTGEEKLEVEEIMRRHGVRYNVRVSDRIAAPAAVAYRGGMILLPASPLPAQASGLEAILLHEAAHLSGRHHLLAAIESLAIAACWWNPLVRIASRHAEEVLEEICDELTIRQQSTGEPLARMLVAFSEECARPLRRPMLTMFRPGERLERRLRRLLSTGDQVMNKSSRFAAFGAASLFLASISLAAAFTARVTSNINQNSFGLSVGTEWTYKSSRGGSGDTIHKSVVDMKSIKGNPVAEIKVSTKDYQIWEYMGSRPDGLWRYQASYLNQWPGVNEDWPASLAYKAGLKKGDKWSWSEIVPVQTGGNYKYDPNDFRLNTTAVVEEVGQEITTPAGTFHVTVVKYDAKGKKLQSQSYRRWISDEAGLVKQESLLPNQVDSLELVSFKPGAGSK